jgi:hypothetical protein
VTSIIDFAYSSVIHLCLNESKTLEENRILHNASAFFINKERNKPGKQEVDVDRASCVNVCKTKETTWPAVLGMTSVFRVKV